MLVRVLTTFAPFLLVLPTLFTVVPLTLSVVSGAAAANYLKGGNDSIAITAVTGGTTFGGSSFRTPQVAMTP